MCDPSSIFLASPKNFKLEFIGSHDGNARYKIIDTVKPEHVIGMLKGNKICPTKNSASKIVQKTSSTEWNTRVIVNAIKQGRFFSELPRGLVVDILSQTIDAKQIQGKETKTIAEEYLDSYYPRK